MFENTATSGLSLRNTEASGSVLVCTACTPLNAY